REAVGFAAGLTLGAAAVAAFTTEAGRRLVRELGREAEPDLRSAAEEWQPMLQELARALRLGAAELTTAIDQGVALVGNTAAAADAARPVGPETASDAKSGQGSDPVAESAHDSPIDSLPDAPSQPA